MPIETTCECGKTVKVNAVPQDVFDSRLKELANQRDGFKKEADTERAARVKLETDSKDWKTAAEELAAVKAKTEEDAALSESGLRLDMANHHRSYLRSRYDDTAPAEGTEKPTFSEWLKAQTAAPDADPFLLALRATPTTSAASPAPGAPVAPAPGSPSAPPAPPRAPVLPPRGEAAPAPASTGLEGVMRAAAAAASAGRPWTREEMAAATKPYLTPKA